MGESSKFVLLACLLVCLVLQKVLSHGDQPLSTVAVHKAMISLLDLAHIKASPSILVLQGQTAESVTLEYSSPIPSIDDWIGVFSPANSRWFVQSKSRISFANPNAPVYPRLALGKLWNEMTVRWTSGYGTDEAEPFVKWGPKGGDHIHSPAGTLTLTRDSLCGAPARTVGWCDPGYIHTSYLKELWPNRIYEYKIGHKLNNGTYIWSQNYKFKAAPFPGQKSLQRVVIFGDMGKEEVDGSSEYNNFRHGSINTTQQLTHDLDNIDIVFHIGDISYGNGYLSQWDQFTAQVEPIASAVPYMIASGNRERDWPGTGSFYENMDSGGECGVLAETMFYVPASNRAKFW